MSSTYIERNIRIKDFWKDTTIPNNALAKLMYYLHSVSSVIDIIDPVLTDYHNYNELTSEQLVEVYNKAKEYNPYIFLSHKVFNVNPDLLHNSLENEFYEITDETIGFHADKEIKIRGRVVKVNKIMVCDNNWMSVYYYGPIFIVEKIVYDIKSRENRNYQSQIVTTESSFHTFEKEKEYVIVPVEFGSTPVAMICARCQVPITTKTESKWNCLSCISCYFCCLFYCIFQVLRKRNLLCFNIIHRCPRCGEIFGVYKSC